MSQVNQSQASQPVEMLVIEQLSALAQETRFRVFRELMAAGPNGLPAGEIAEALGVAPNTLSTHLAILKRSKLAEVRRAGRSLYYSASIDAVGGLIESLIQDCCRNHPELCSSLTIRKGLDC